MRKGSIVWGVLLVAAGFLFLLSNLGILSINVWNVIWPLALVLFGLWILSGAIFGRPNRLSDERAHIPLQGARRAHITVQHGAGRLTVKSGTNEGVLVEGMFGGGLDYSARSEGEMLDVRMRMRARKDWAPWFWNTQGYDWDFKLNPQIPISLNFETGANEMFLDLTDLCVSDLELGTGASSNRVLLPARAGETRVKVKAGAASVKLGVPAEVAARVRVRGGLAGVDVDTRRFQRVGDAYESADYGSAKNKVDIDAEIGAGSLRVE